MSSLSTVTQALATLGLRPGCSWDEVRQQHRRLAFMWHPDRHISSPDAEGIAERAKEINAAFDLLASYYHSRKRGTESTPDVHPRPERFERLAPQHVTEQSPGYPARSAGAYALAAVGIAVLALWILARLAIEPDSSATSVPTADTSPGALALDVGASKEPATGQGTSGFEELRAGADRQEVLDVLGEPAEVAGDAWHYDAGVVFFRNGVVAHWLVAARPPFDGRSSPAGDDEHVSYGSTRADVRRILGAPAAEGDGQWTYGPSQIYFEHGRVSGWHVSPLQPLKVKER